MQKPPLVIHPRKGTRPVQKALADISRWLAAAGLNPGPVIRRHDPPEAIPTEPGSYLLAIRLVRFCSLPHGRHAGKTLPAGLYVYAGSARGPGGLRARVHRHLRKEKRLRWHVDALTMAAEDIVALLYPGELPSECDLIEALLECGRFEPALPGLGSSDCRRCPAHALRLKTRC